MDFMNANVSVNGSAVVSTYYDWDAYSYTFIPNYRNLSIDTNKTGPQNFTYQMYLQDDKKGFVGFYGSEPQKTPNQR